MEGVAHETPGRARVAARDEAVNKDEDAFKVCARVVVGRAQFDCLPADEQAREAALHETHHVRRNHMTGGGLTGGRGDGATGRARAAATAALILLLPVSPSLRPPVAVPLGESCGGGEEHVEARVFVEHFKSLLRGGFGRVLVNLSTADAAEGCADARVQEAQVIVDLGLRADGRARVARRVLLTDGYGRGDA